VSVRLRDRVVDSQRVRVLIATKLGEPDRAAPRRVFDAFAAAVDAEFFGGPFPVTRQKHEGEGRAGHGGVMDVFEADFGRLGWRSFATLSDMVRASVPGALRVEVHEQGRDERELVVREFQRDARPTLPHVGWDVYFEPDDEPQLLLRFWRRPA